MSFNLETPAFSDVSLPVRERAHSFQAFVQLQRQGQQIIRPAVAEQAEVRRLRSGQLVVERFGTKQRGTREGRRQRRYANRSTAFARIPKVCTDVLLPLTQVTLTLVIYHVPAGQALQLVCMSYAETENAFMAVWARIKQTAPRQFHGTLQAWCVMPIHKYWCMAWSTWCLQWTKCRRPLKS